MNCRCKLKQDEEGKYIANGQAAKSGLNKSLADSELGQFANQVLPFKAAKAGKLTVKVDLTRTS